MTNDDIPPTVPVHTPGPQAAGVASTGPPSPADPSATTVPDPAARPGFVPDSPAGYELFDEVGRGGMGVVYRARDAGLNREVAVKLLLGAAAADSDTAARFFEEAQITGQLQHPGVPAVYQAGRTPAGRPFLAMKLIRGDTLSHMVKNAAKFNPLAVFEGVCQTLAYAHAHGVIHRDLKPANVMVGAFGEVQVMDWGLAKTLAGSPPAAARPIGTPRTPDTETQYGSVMGTPAFMPPEQAAGETDKIDRRSDVFGLGAVLCVLLTGTPPYRGESGELVFQLAARGETADALARLDACGADPGLVALCKRCLAVAPAGRPADAAAVAAEIAALRQAADDRAKQAELAAARAAVAAAEQRKRRRVQLAAGGLLVVALAAGAGVSLWQLVRATTAEGVAEEKADLAKRKAAAATAAKAFLQAVLTQASPEGYATFDRPPKENMRLAEALDYASKAIDGKFADDPETAADLRGTIGLAYMEVGKYAAAEPHLTACLALRDAALGPAHPETLVAAHNLAGLYFHTGNYAAAAPLFARGLAGNEAARGPDHPNALGNATGLGLVALKTGDFATAERMFRRVAAAREAAGGAAHAAALNNLAGLYHAKGDYAAARPLHERALAVREAAGGPAHPDTLVSLNNLATTCMELKDDAAAEPLLKRALAGFVTAYTADHPAALTAANNLAEFYKARGNLAAAEPLIRRALAGFERTLGPDHVTTLSAVANLAGLLFLRGDAAAAEPLFRRGAEAAAAADFRPPGAEIFVANYASCLEALGQFAAAEVWHRKWFAHLAAGGRSPRADQLAALGRNLVAQKKWPQAETVLRDCVAAADKLFAAGRIPRWRLADTQLLLGGALYEQRKYDAAEPYLKAGYEGTVADADKLPPASRSKRLFDAGGRLAALYDAMNRPEKAAALRATLPREPAPAQRPGR